MLLDFPYKKQQTLLFFNIANKIYKRYQNELEKNNQIDFADMISLANKKLETLGNVSGYGFDMNPEHGDFRYVMEPDTEGIFHVNVPRQYDSSLILRVAEDDRSLRDFAIGEYLEEGGYDWTARELADVELVIDYAKADLTLTVEDWEVSFGFNVVI